MESITLSMDELKSLMRETVKETLAEMLIDKNELFEILEDRAFGRMMKEADNSEFADEDDVMQILQK